MFEFCYICDSDVDEDELFGIVMFFFLIDYN